MYSYINFEDGFFQIDSFALAHPSATNLCVGAEHTRLTSVSTQNEWDTSLWGGWLTP